MQKELLSAYVDNEDNMQEFVQEIYQDEQLQQSWNTYHMIGSILRQESPVLLDNDFTNKMAQLIDAEPALNLQILEEQPNINVDVNKLNLKQKLYSVFSPILQVGVAASVCLIVILGIQNINLFQTDNSEPTLQTLPFSNALQPVSYSRPIVNDVELQKAELQNKNIRLMLQDHELEKRMFSSEIFASDVK